MHLVPPNNSKFNVNLFSDMKHTTIWRKNYLFIDRYNSISNL